MISHFLTHHKRGCPGNKGHDCVCGLYEARTELERLQAKDRPTFELGGTELSYISKIIHLGHSIDWIDAPLAAQELKDIKATLEESKPLVEAMIGIGSAARDVIVDIDRLLELLKDV